jgi:hypothetical protein
MTIKKIGPHELSDDEDDEKQLMEAWLGKPCYFCGEITRGTVFNFYDIEKKGKWRRFPICGNCGKDLRMDMDLGTRRRKYEGIKDSKK